MSEQMAAQLFAELQEIRMLLTQLQAQVERITRQLNQEPEPQNVYSFSSLIGLGASGLADISENHDQYVGEAILHEHLC